MNASLRRGACPSLSAPMPTGDGLLARLIPAGPIALEKFVAFCAAAQRHGNGTIEVSTRGSVQVRGLTPRSAPAFAADAGELDLAADGLPVIAGPLAGDPAAPVDADALAAQVRQAIAQADLVLAPKVCVLIDGGGTLHLDALAADIRLRAIARADEPRLHLAIAGDAETATALGLVASDHAPALVVALLRAISSRNALRAADVIRREGIAAFRAVVADKLEDAPLPPSRAKAEPIGRHALRSNQFALGIGLAFGHAEAATLIELARRAAALGAQWIRPAPERALLLGALARERLDAAAAEAGRLGFVVAADDTRRKLVACPGTPACASAHIAARALACEIAARAPHHDLPEIHISGCAKGCAHAKAAALTIVGTERGCDVIYDGTARSPANATIERADLAAKIVELVAARDGGRHG